MVKIATCPICGQDFEYDTRRVRSKIYCSRVCKSKAQYGRRCERADGERKCPRCGITKPGAEFSSGTHSYCRPCSAQYSGERRPGLTEERARWARIFTLRRHGLTEESF